jgi:hypothetical protein
VTEHTSPFWWSCPACLEERLRVAEEEAYELQNQAQTSLRDQAQINEAKRVVQFAKDQLREMEKSK